MLYYSLKIHILFIIFQHDERFIPPNPGDGWSTYPNEHFFIRKFNNDISLSGKKLRQEEWEQFRQRYSSESPMFHHHIRDYHTVCRGEKLVSLPERNFSRIFLMLSYIY